MPTHWTERLPNWWEAGGSAGDPAGSISRFSKKFLTKWRGQEPDGHLAEANGAVQSGAGGLTGTILVLRVGR